MKMGEMIRTLRRKAGKTQEALAEALGMSTQAVSRWESGGGYPDVEMIPRIANYFHVSIDELFGYDGDRQERIASRFWKCFAFRSMGTSYLRIILIYN